MVFNIKVFLEINLNPFISRNCDNPRTIHVMGINRWIIRRHKNTACHCIGQSQVTSTGHLDFTKDQRESRSIISTVRYKSDIQHIAGRFHRRGLICATVFALGSAA